MEPLASEGTSGRQGGSKLAVEDLLSQGVVIGVLATGVRLAAPFLFASLGEMFAQRSGVFNLGVEGIMMMGAFTGFLVTLRMGNPYLGVAVAILVGAVLGLLMAFISVTMQAEQGISGIGLYMFCWGLSGLLFRIYVGFITSIKGFGPVHVPVLSRIPVIGPILFQHNWLVYLALALVPVSWFVLYKTTWGLKVRAVGTTPEAADTLGVNVNAIRYECVILGSALAGLAGAFLTVGQANMYADNITAGRGFIAVALVYFGRWSPVGILAGSLLFSMMNALQLWIQVLGINFPYEFAVILPYVMTIAALAVAVRHVWAPAALGKPFEREAS
ncbi:MAG: ral nucleoside transport system permease protein [Bacillota bacterium]|nr:ral nucleoside transport system permease protein [Bacillota bacterium]